MILISDIYNPSIAVGWHGPIAAMDVAIAQHASGPYLTVKGVGHRLYGFVEHGGHSTDRGKPHNGQQLGVFVVGENAQQPADRFHYYYLR